MRTLYRASRVRTLALPAEGEWVLVDDRHVERVGTGDPPGADRTVDLPGTTILPGFIDAHVHLSGTGMLAHSLDLAGAASREDVVAAAREHVGDHPGPALGMNMDETGWPDPGFPSREDLDGISSDPLLLIRVDGYVSAANTAAIESFDLREAMGLERGPDAEPTGILRHEANAQAQRRYFESLPDARIQEAQLEAAALAASRGVTCVHEMSIPDKRGRRDLEVLLGHLRELPVDAVVYVADRDIPYVMELGLGRIGGDLFLDGSIGARTAVLLDPYEDGEGAGSLAYEDDDLADFLHNAHLAGLQAGLHCIGDGAIEQALRTWERVYLDLDSRQRRHFRARRHRLEHFEMASSEQVERAAGVGLAISVQPAFDAAWGGEEGMYERRLGIERAWRMNPIRSLLARGLEVGGGSDSPVTPLDPMLGMWALENHHDPEQRVDRSDALLLFTVGGARLAHLEKKGRLQPGSAADLAAFDADPLDVADPRDLRPVLTVSRGREVFAR